MPFTLVDVPEAYAVPVVFSLIFVLGVAGNGTLIYVILAHKRMRSKPNVLIVSLAVGDLALLLVSVPFTATIYTFAEWPYGEAICKLNAFMQAVSLAASVFTLMALSADRYGAIVDPLTQRQRSSTVATLLAVAVIWLASAAFASLEAVAARVETVDNTTVCNAHPHAWGDAYSKFHAMYRFVVYFVVPIVVIAAFYVLIARALVRSSRHAATEEAPRNSQMRRQDVARKKVAKIVLSFVIIFVVCWLPRHVYRLWYNYDAGEYNMFWHVFKLVGFCLSFVNSCVNPFSLYVLSRQFRRYYDQYLFCCCCSAGREPARYGTYRGGSPPNTMNETRTPLTQRTQLDRKILIVSAL